MTRYYTGIGSRSTPPELEFTIRILAFELARLGFVLRSGAADGADAMFERSAIMAGGRTEIWLPWAGFNGHGSSYVVDSPKAYELAASVHPAWGRCSEAAQHLHARNVHQVLGVDLRTPSELVVCWTPGGETVGGTATAIRIAERFGVPVHNLGRSV